MLNALHSLRAVAERPQGSGLGEALRSRTLWAARAKAAFGPVARILALVMLFVLLETLIRRIGQLPEASYHQPFIVVELGERILGIATSRRVLPFLAAAAVGGLWLLRSSRWRRNLARLGRGWSELEHGSALRLLIGFVALVAAWSFTTYDYNLYFHQGHYLDRLLLLLLVPLLIWRPICLLPFLLLLVAVISQFDHPLGMYPWTEANLLIRILVLFLAAFLLYGFSGRHSTSDFLFVLCCLIAANYWWSGWGKLRLNWISHPHLNLLVFGAYANGWLAFLAPASVTSLSEALAWLNLPLMAFTLVVEWGALLILWRRYTLLGFLAGCIALHLGIFAVTGMFFWKWILAEAALLGFLLSDQRRHGLPIFTRTHLLLSLLLIGGCTLWIKPSNLSWYDTPLAYTLRMEGVGESGTVYSLPARAFTPYADVFTLGPFSYLNPYPQLTGIWGITTEHLLADTLLRLRTADQVYSLERTLGTTSYNAASSERFDAFITRFMGNLNQRRSKQTWLSSVQAPPHLWSFPTGNSFRMQEPITRVIVYRVTSFYDGERYSEIRKERIREIRVPLSPPPRRSAHRG